MGNGISYYWISGVETYHFQGCDEKCQTGSLNGKLADAHQVLGSNAFCSNTGNLSFSKWDRFVQLRHRGFMMNGILTNGTTAGV